MASVAYVTVDVFTATRFGGNPLAVVPDARGLDAGLMQAIAAEFHYSETTFVLPPDDAANTARVRIFTPTQEIPFAGHPNVGTGFALARAGSLFGRPVGEAMRFEEAAGLVEVALTRDGDAVTGARIRAPRPLAIGAEVALGVIAACASIEEGDVAATLHPPLVASVGLPFAIAEVAGLEALGRAKPNAAAFAAANARHPHPDDRFSLFLYCRVADGRVRARMFAPLDNVIEDPATGSASAALAALMAHLGPGPDAVSELVIEQGVEMGRPSRIELIAHKHGGTVREVIVGGGCVPVMAGTIEV
jgi:trans-2,3-dihydro-3-hydroxyanthranilate isomerase